MGYRNDLLKGSKAERDMSVEKIADQSGVSKNTVSKILNGALNVTMQNVLAVCSAVEFPPHRLFEQKQESQQ